MDLRSLVNLSDLDEVLPVLEKHSSEVRAGLSKQSNPDLLNGVKDWWAKNPYQDVIRNGAIGAAGGAALGGLGSLALGPSGRKRPLAGAMMGGLLGGAAGAGYRLWTGDTGSPGFSTPAPRPDPVSGAGIGALGELAASPARPYRTGLSEISGARPPGQSGRGDLNLGGPHGFAGVTPQTAERGPMPPDPARLAALNRSIPRDLINPVDDLRLSGAGSMGGSYAPFTNLTTSIQAMREGRNTAALHHLLPSPDVIVESPGTIGYVAGGTLAAQGVAHPFVRALRDADNASAINAASPIPGPSKPGVIPSAAQLRNSQIRSMSSGQIFRGMVRHNLGIGNEATRELAAVAHGARPPVGRSAAALRFLLPHLVTQYYGNQVSNAQRLQAAVAHPDAPASEVPGQAATLQSAAESLRAAIADPSGGAALPVIPPSNQSETANQLRQILTDFRERQELRSRSGLPLAGIPLGRSLGR